VDLVEDDQGEDLADAWDGTQAQKGVGVMFSRGPQDEEFQFL
jgi:hypothetical protein